MTNLDFLLPEVIYGVVGKECNLYFANISNAININNYFFEVNCEKGSCFSDCWRLVPSKDDIGEFSLKVIVHSDFGVVFEGKSKVVVVDNESNTNRDYSVLLMGASGTIAKDGVCLQLFNNLTKDESLNMKMVGSVAPGYQDVKPNGACCDAWGGWNWDTFFLRYNMDESDCNDGLHPSRPSLTNSRFLFPNEKGEIKFDFEKYCQKYNSSKAPDFIIISLGINGILTYDANSISKVLDERIGNYMEKMLKEMRRFAPDVKIAIVQQIYPSASQDAFGYNYKCEVNHYTAINNLIALNRYYVKRHAKDDLDYGVIPAYINIDCVNNYPKIEDFICQTSQKLIYRANNAFHPIAEGSAQIADAIYAYIKYKINC